MKIDIRNHSSMSGIEKVAEELYKFAQKRLGFDKPARIVFESQGDRAINILAPTANYNPQTKTVRVFVDHRHPKDILRSMAHELVHHAQCCLGEFAAPMDTSAGYAQKDQRMRDLERDAYFWGNGILFRDWEDEHKRKRSWNLMNENKKMSLNEQKLRQKIRRMIMETLQEQDMNMADEIAADLAADVEETDIDTSGGLDPTGTSTPPPDVDPEVLRTVQEGKGHGCASHVKENLSGREGRCINHTLLEDGSVTHYTVEFQNEIVENIPVGRLTILEMNEHMHGAKRDDYDHDESKPRKPFEEGEELEEEKPLKEWYNDTLHEALLRKFKIKK